MDSGPDVPHGLRRAYPEERRCTTSPWTASGSTAPGQGASPLRRGDGTRHLRRAAARPADYPGRLPEMLSGLDGVREAAGPVDRCTSPRLVEFCPARAGGIPRARAARSTASTPPGGARRLRGRRRVRRLGGQGRCRPRRSGRSRRAGARRREFTWGDEFAPGGSTMANTWQGEFPWQNLRPTATKVPRRWHVPAERLRAVRHGGQHLGVDDRLVRAAHPERRAEACCIPANPRVTSVEGSYDPRAESIPRKVIKGGSHLCAPNYCCRYRPAARQAEAIDTSTSHIGFRCIVRP